MADGPGRDPLGTTSGWGGIRTPGTVSRTAVFKTAALVHSATHPSYVITTVYGLTAGFDLLPLTPILTPGLPWGCVDTRLMKPGVGNAILPFGLEVIHHAQVYQAQAGRQAKNRTRTSRDTPTTQDDG